MEYRAVLFDLFGSLVPCYPLERLERVVCEMAHDLRVPKEPFASVWKETLGEQLKGEFPSLESMIRFLLQQLNCPMYSEGLDSAVKRRLAVERASLRPRSDALAALTCLRSRGLRIGVITNCSRETVDAWSSSELSRVVDHCAFSCVVGSVKPDPIIYLHACSALSIDPGERLFVADGSNEELEGAIRVGMDAVLIRGFDDDGSFPGRIERDHWTGAFVSALSEVPTLV